MAKVDILRLDSVTANDTTATALINENFEAIQDALENTLSRDGTVPNYMDANLDMNSYKIINIADPVDDLDVVNLRYLKTFAGNLEALVIQATSAANSALRSATDAGNSAQIAATARETAVAAKNIAEASAISAQASANSALTSKTAAESAAESAEESAESAQAYAESAAESAEYIVNNAPETTITATETGAIITTKDLTHGEVSVEILNGEKGDKGDKGDTGNSGVEVSTTEPTDPDVEVWINPNGDGSQVVEDVTVNGTSVVQNGIAIIDLSGLANKDLSNLSEAGEKRLTDISDAVSTERNARIQEDGRLSQRIEEVNSNIGNGTLTIKKDGVRVGTFSANQKGNTEIDLTHAPQKQADWNQENQQEVDFIKNKPTALSAFTNDLEFTPETLQGTTANFVPGQTYSYEESLQRIANLFDGWDTAYVQRFSSYVTSDTTPENHLMNKSQTDYAIQTNSSNFRGSFANWTSVPADVSGYLPDASESTTPTNHDYIVVENMSDFPVLDPSQAMSGRWRMTYNGDWSELGVSGWYPEYKIDVTFTQAQQAAIDSGATSAKISQYDGYNARITSVETDKVDKDYTSGKKLYGKSATLGQVMYRPGDHIELTDDGIIKVVGVTEQLTGDVPVASDSNLGQIFQYTGPTNETFENGLFYRAEKVAPTDYTVVTSDPDIMIDISIDGDTFSRHYVSGKSTYIYTYQKPGLWFGQWYDEDGNQVFPSDLGIRWRESMDNIQDGTTITVTAGQENAAWREVVVSTMKNVLRQYDDSTLPNPADVVGLPFQYIGKGRMDMWYGGFFEAKPFGEGDYYISDFSPSLGGISMDPMLFQDFVWNEIGSNLAEISFVYQDGLLLSGWICEQAPMMFRSDLSEIGITVDNEPQPGNQIIISNDNITYQFTNISVSDIYTNDNRVDIQYDSNGIPVINLYNVPEQTDYMEWPYEELDGKVVQFIGNDYDQYVCGYFYRCEQDMGGNWYWRQLDVQPGGGSGGDTVTAGTGISIYSSMLEPNRKTVSVDTNYLSNNYNKKLYPTTFTLLASNWSGDTYTASISGISTTSIVWVSPDALSAPAYANAQILCTGQGTNTLTFSKTGEVTDDITVNIVIG